MSDLFRLTDEQMERLRPSSSGSNQRALTLNRLWREAGERDHMIDTSVETADQHKLPPVSSGIEFG